MLEMGTSGLMSGEGKPVDYLSVPITRPSSTLLGSRPIEYVLGAMKSSCDSRSRGQVVRSKQPAYSLALPAVCM